MTKPNNERNLNNSLSINVYSLWIKEICQIIVLFVLVARIKNCRLIIKKSLLKFCAGEL